MDLLLAAHNEHKTREFRELLGDQFEIADLSFFPKIAMPHETGATFAENAILKAVTISRDRHFQDRLVIADDSGLEVDALAGEPGIYSARYAGEPANDAANIDKLLRELKDVANRAARFRCVIALARAGRVLGTFQGLVEGAIVDTPRGRNGFGYDSVFQPTGFKKTFAEMPASLKNQLSHRAKAVADLCQKLHAMN